MSLNCVWCGKPVDVFGGFVLERASHRAACLACAPDQGGALVPERDEVFEPGPVYVAQIATLRAHLRRSCFGEVSKPTS